MKKSWYICLCFLLGCTTPEQSGKVFDNLSFNSDILDKEIPYSVYLPAGYDTLTRSYPVLYLLHGYSDDHTGWIQLGEANHIANRCIADGEAPEMIIVMPDAGVSWYINDYTGKIRYEDMFFEELIPYMEKTYRIHGRKEFRAIAGLSMGGFGSMLYALKHPDMFAACCPLSAGIFTVQGIEQIPEEQYTLMLAPAFGETDRNKPTDHWRQNNILSLIEKIPNDQKHAVRFYIDCGDDDFLYQGNISLHTLMSDKQIPHEFRVRNGGHTWKYWRTALPEVLKFVGQSFRREINAIN